MLVELDALIDANNGLEIVPVYMDEDLYVRDTQTPPNYCVNPVIILKRETFLQKYNEDLPDNAPYVVVVMADIHEISLSYCMLELEHLLNNHYDLFVQYEKYFTDYGFDEKTQDIYIKNTQPMPTKVSNAMAKIVQERDIGVAMRESAGDASYYIIKLALEQMEFVKRKYAKLIEPNQTACIIQSLVKEMQSRLSHIRSCLFWYIPVTHLVPGTLLDYAVAEALGMKIQPNDTYGFLVKYNEDYMKELHGVLKEKDGTLWGEFSPSSDGELNDYVIQTYLVNKLGKEDPVETVVTPEQLRSWPNWDEKYSDESVISRYAACASIVLNESKEDPIQHIKMVKIPESLLRFKE